MQIYDTAARGFQRFKSRVLARLLAKISADASGHGPPERTVAAYGSVPPQAENPEVLSEHPGPQQ